MNLALVGNYWEGATGYGGSLNQETVRLHFPEAIVMKIIESVIVSLSILSYFSVVTKDTMGVFPLKSIYIYACIATTLRNLTFEQFIMARLLTKIILI